MSIDRCESEIKLHAGGVSIEANPLAGGSGVWYVAHTRSRNEKQLARELGILEIYHYLPLAQRVTRSRATGRRSESWVPVFPGYVFFRGGEDERYRALRTNRVAQVIPVPHQEQLVAELQHVHHLLSQEGDFFVSERLSAGQWGRITSGPLSGLEGIIMQVTGRYRLTMNVTLLGQSVMTEVDQQSVEQISPPDYS